MDALREILNLCSLVIITLIFDVHAYDQCTPSTFCEDGYHCCDYDTRCCPDSVLTVAGIIGIVFACLIVISCIVAVICCVTKQGHKQGQVVQPAPQPGVSVVTNAYPQGQPGYGQPMYGQQTYGQPPPYGQQMYGAQQSHSVDKAGTSDPAYPPPPPAYY